MKKLMARIPVKTVQSLVLIAGVLAIFISGALLAGLISFGLVHNLALSRWDGGSPESVTLSPAEATAAAIQGGSPGGVNQNIPEMEPALTPWDGAGRVTILLLGLDYRDWEAKNDYSRSDTMILLTLDPLSKTAGILSIPRDLWVDIPGFKHGKINTAYYLGDAYKLPGGGPGLAVKTVEQFIGVPVNYYAQIDFGAFVRFIDEIGGVKISVPEAIKVDLLGSGSATKKTLQPGVQVLPGEWTLAYARARYTEGGDFDRARRQQQVILAIRDRILSLDMLPVLVSKANVLYNELASGIHTNLKLEDAVQLAVLASQVPEENIHHEVIGEKQVLFGESPDDLSILIPMVDKIHLLRDQIFTSSGALGPLTPGGSQERMIAEAARVSVLNGSSSPDLAQRTADYLKSLGVNVVAVNEAPQRVSQSRLTDYTGAPFTLKYLTELMPEAAPAIYMGDGTNNGVDVELILGNDWASSNPLQ
jgi:LCP family protein required for cell wall assembly